MDFNNEIHEIEVSLEHAKSVVEMGKALERLRNNKDYKLVIEKGYLEDQALRLAHACGASEMNANQEIIFDELKAISMFAQYLRITAQQANLATNSIKEHEQSLEDVRFESINSGIQ